MLFKRCDVCCDALDNVDGNTVYECSKEVKDKLGIEHICEECLDGTDDLVLTNQSTYSYIVEFKDENNGM